MASKTAACMIAAARECCGGFPGSAAATVVNAMAFQSVTTSAAAGLGAARHSTAKVSAARARPGRLQRGCSFSVNIILISFRIFGKIIVNIVSSSYSNLFQ